MYIYFLITLIVTEILKGGQYWKESKIREIPLQCFHRIKCKYIHEI